MITFKCQLEKMRPLPCEEAIDWVGDRDLKTAWAECERADWMLWFARHIMKNPKLPIRATAACGRTSLPYAGKFRPDLESIYDIIDGWIDGTKSVQDLEDAKASADAESAKASADSEAAWSSADAARYVIEASRASADAASADAASAAEASAYAAWSSADAASADAASADAASAAEASALKQMADIVRSIISVSDLLCSYQQCESAKWAFKYEIMTGKIPDSHYKEPVSREEPILRKLRLE
jgi:hypothetical protein